MNINMNDFIRMQQQRACKDITAEVEISPSPCDKAAYEAWWKKENKRKREMMPMVINNEK